MTVPTIKVKVVRRPQIKVKTLVKFPANVVTRNFLTVTNSGGTYTFSIDYSVLTAGPVLDPTTAYIAVSDATAGIYRTVTLASLLTSGLDADLQAIAALAGAGILVKTAANTWVFRTATGTANEITVTNGDGVAGNPTLSLPSALTFTGKTITGGTYASAVTFNKVTITAPATAATLTLIDGTTLTGPAASGTVMTLGNTETVTGVKTFGSAGAVGRFKLAGTTSGTTILDASATASGTLTLPAATDTLVGKATTDILTNKTYDTAGAGNSFSINSLAATANTGTGAVVRATSPALVTPALGTPTALVLTNATGLPLSGHTTQAAFTFVGNNTSGAAVPTAVDIATLTTKASPGAGDFAIISDQAASGAWKKATVSSLASAGSVSSIAGNTGAFTLTYPITNVTNAIVSVAPFNCGRLTFVSTTAIKFSPYNGDLIKISGVLFQIPSAGIAGVANTSVFVEGVGGSNLAASTFYYVYAFNNSGTVTADFSTTAHTTDSAGANIGTEIKTGNPTRSLIGIAFTNASSQFSDFLTLSWFNRRTKVNTVVVTSNSNITGTTAFTEFSSSWRNTFVVWAGDAPIISLSGGFFVTNVATNAYVGVGIDGATPEDSGVSILSGSTALLGVGLTFAKSGLAESNHFATPVGSESSGAETLTLVGSATASKRTAINVMVQG